MSGNILDMCITQIRNADGEKDVAMRQLLYSMVVLEGDQMAQKVYSSYTILYQSIRYCTIL